MIFSDSARKLEEYLLKMGILSCNDNPYLPSLSDIGCVWEDVTALIDAHAIFYCKAYRNRTVYLSPEAYTLLCACRTPQKCSPDAKTVYELLRELGPVSKKALKPLCRLEPSRFEKAFGRLLEQCRITAFRNGRVLTPNWSSFVYSTDQAWAAAAGLPDKVMACREAMPKLKKLLLRSMPEKELERLLR